MDLETLKQTAPAESESFISDEGFSRSKVEGLSVATEKTWAIKVDRVSKNYNLYKRPSDRLKQMLFGWRKSYFTKFPALKDVSLEVKKGETVGIVGRNGSGKSTLLQIICGTVAASAGSVNVNGRIAALLELGAGFNPEFSGRENVYLNGSILGLSRQEIEARFESIAEFAEIGEFIEHPVKTYSSGMYVRLAFATAINADPNVLVVDEALAVGDEAFRRKCFARIEQIKNDGATILFVSHSAGSIMQLCSRAILLDKGEKLIEGPPKLIINHYQRLTNLSADEIEPVRKEIISSAKTTEETVQKPTKLAPQLALQESFDPNLISNSKIVFESKGAQISNLKIENEHGDQVNTLQVGRKYSYSYEVSFQKNFSRVSFGMLIKTTKGIDVVGCSTLDTPELHRRNIDAGSKVKAKFDFVCNLRPSTYFINAGVTNPQPDESTYLHRILDGLVFHVAPIESSTSTGIVDTGVSLQTEIVG